MNTIDFIEAEQRRTDLSGQLAMRNPQIPAAASPHRHCTQCGAEVADGKKFCGKCGEKV